jgi:hypothetical protein
VADEPPVEVSVSTEGLDALVRALRAEEDGKALRKELAKGMRDALKPAVDQAKSNVMAMTALSTASPALRTGVARKIRAEVKLGGRWTGARVKARKTPGLRNFANAAKRLQAAGGWRTQSWGRGQWRTQHGKVDWFDRAMEPSAARARQAIHEAMESMAARIRDRARSHN